MAYSASASASISYGGGSSGGSAPSPCRPGEHWHACAERQLAEIAARKAEEERKRESLRQTLVSGELVGVTQATTADKAGAYAASAEGYRRASSFAREQARYGLDRGSPAAEQRAQSYDSNALRADAFAKQNQRSVRGGGMRLARALPSMQLTTRQLGIEQAPTSSGGALPYVAAAAAAAGVGWYLFIR